MMILNGIYYCPELDKLWTLEVRRKKPYIYLDGVRVRNGSSELKDLMTRYISHEIGML